MKKILYPTDFSACADNALDYAIALAEKLNAKLILHHSCGMPTFVNGIPILEYNRENILANALNHLRAYTKFAPLKEKNLWVDDDVSFGLPSNTIAEVARNKNVDLIVMGTKGANGIKELLNGSIATSVMEKVPCPIFIVPENAVYNDINKIVFAIDYGKNVIKTISKFADLAALFNAEIIIIRISDLPYNDALEREVFENFKKEVLSQISYKNLSFQLELGTNIADTLLTAIEKVNADILAMSMRNRNILMKFFQQSLTKKMAHHSKVPVLAFHQVKDNSVELRFEDVKFNVVRQPQ